MVSNSGQGFVQTLIKCTLTFYKDTFFAEDIQTVTDTALKIHPKEGHPQVLCREDVSGHSYWEAEWKSQACYTGLTHKGEGESQYEVLGTTDKSWVMMCHRNTYHVFHNGTKSEKTLVSTASQRVGACLDNLGGSLSFYIVTKDTAKLLHKVHATFTEPSYPAFLMGPNTSI